MDIFQAIILGIVQGITEFAPVSSSAHLVLVPWLLGWREPSLAFDTVLHLGTLVAVLAVFWRDVLMLVAAWFRSFKPEGRKASEARLAWVLIVGTIPAAVLGYFLKKSFEELFSQPMWVGGFLIVTALALAAAEQLGRRQGDATRLTALRGFLVGVAQAVAIAPGISRSGATITAGMAMGLSRSESAKFSFLLSIPIILGAAGSQLRDLAKAGGLETSAGPMVAGFLVAAISGYICISLLLQYLRTRSLYVFAVYCALVGVVAVAVGLFR